MIIRAIFGHRQMDLLLGNQFPGRSWIFTRNGMKGNIYLIHREIYLFHCVGRDRGMMYCLWQYGENTHKKIFRYPNGNEKRIQWTQEVEKDQTIPFLDMKLKKVENKIHIGIYRKESHTILKIFNLQVEQTWE